MNERIKKLYEQAHIERRQEYFSSEVDPTIKSVSVTRHFDPNLFAELIIEECMYVGRLSQINNGLVDSDIKDHFYGVEE